jgi:Flp pilus assembly pilin Flp
VVTNVTAVLGFHSQGRGYAFSKEGSEAMPRLPHKGQRLEERGATSTEYALLISLIALFIIGSLAAIGTNLTRIYDQSCGDVASVAGNSNC